MILPDVYSYLIAHNTGLPVLQTYRCKNKTDSWKWIEAIILSEYIYILIAYLLSNMHGRGTWTSLSSAQWETALKEAFPDV